jgi:hypothetical protein
VLDPKERDFTFKILAGWICKKKCLGSLCICVPIVRRASEILDFPSENSLWRAFWAFRHRRGSCVGNRRRRRRPRATSNQRSIRYFQGRALGSPPVHRHKLKRIARHGEAEKTTPFVSSCYPVHCTNIILKGILRRRRWWHRSRKGRRHCAILAEQTSEGPFRNSCFFLPDQICGRRFRRENTRYVGGGIGDEDSTVSDGLGKNRDTLMLREGV